MLKEIKQQHEVKLANILGVIALYHSPRLVVRLGWLAGQFSRLYHQRKLMKTKSIGDKKILS